MEGDRNRPNRDIGGAVFLAKHKWGPTAREFMREGECAPKSSGRAKKDVKTDSRAPAPTLPRPAHRRPPSRPDGFTEQRGDVILTNRPKNYNRLLQNHWKGNGAQTP